MLLSSTLTSELTRDFISGGLFALTFTKAGNLKTILKFLLKHDCVLTLLSAHQGLYETSNCEITEINKLN